ncbi:MAG TPA: DUF1735 domain-containing protein [Bacteroidales bacterium]|nr:DUF1735 domain-containing protein [Bacteroidales bacterium]HRW85567.1 DUF1735 domain-containing protein [Bacteroidales bacterium]
MKKSKIIFIALLVLATLSFTSCLNDLEDFMGGFSGSPAIAELSEAPSPATGTIIREIIDPTQPLEVNFRVGIAVAKPLSKAVTVTLAIDNALVTAYNTERNLTGDAAALPMPAAALGISSYEVTIPAGELEADWNITVDAEQVPDIVVKFYIIPVKIASVTENVVISGNYGTKLMRIMSRNKYDGLYLLKGMHNRVPYNYPYETQMQMRTAGPASVAFWWPDANSFGHPIGVGPDNELSWYGSAVSPVVEFDPVTNLVTNVYNQSTAVVITMFTGEGANSNSYDPVTKTIYVSWNYSNNPLRAFFDTLTFIRPR